MNETLFVLKVKTPDLNLVFKKYCLKPIKLILRVVKMDLFIGAITAENSPRGAHLKISSSAIYPAFIY